uniref:Uncharacterized protein n=1 Tax=Lepeophtheirus salmonis TaxID=72036 RepID=A0A0K2SZZ2_LEPSM
MLVTVHYGLF